MPNCLAGKGIKLSVDSLETTLIELPLISFVDIRNNMAVLGLILRGIIKNLFSLLCEESIVYEAT